MNTNNIRFYAKAAASLVIALSLIILSFGVAVKDKESLEIIEKNSTLFQRSAEAKSRTILAKPLELKVGEKFSPDRLTKHLESIGYTQVNTFDNQKPATYTVEGVSVKISPRFSSLYESLSISFMGEKVVSIQNLPSLEPKKICQIEAETLGTFMVDGTNGEKVRASRKYISYEEIKDSHLLKAIISSEDSAFFWHHGINYKGLASAVYRHLNQLIKTRSIDEKDGSGSSITQQLVKNIFLNSKKTLDRKSQEMFLATSLENKITKEQIIELYLNTIYFGHIKVDDYSRAIYGISAASEYYFGKEPNDLTISEACVIASLIDAPGIYKENPNHPKLVERRNRTLRLMQENFPDKYSDDLIRQAKNEQPVFKLMVKNENDILSQTFVNFAYKFMQTDKDFSGEENGKSSYVLQTQVNGKLLKSTNQILSKHLRKFGKTIANVTNKSNLAFAVSLVALERETGQIILMDGLRLENDEISPANDVFDSTGRDIASSIKPFILAFALQKGYINLDTTINPNDCMAPDGWIPKDSSDSPDTLRNFFVRSKNKSMLCVLGSSNIANKTSYTEFLRFWGKIVQKECDKEINYRIANGINHSCAKLSTLQLASIYTMFPDGIIRRPSVFSKIFRNGEEVKVTQSAPEKLADPANLVDLTKAMRAIVDNEIGNISGATAGDLRSKAGLPLNVDILGKSGSSELDFLMTTIHPKMVLSVRLSIIPQDEQEISTEGVVSSDTTVPLATELISNIYHLQPTLIEGKFNGK